MIREALGREIKLPNYLTLLKHKLVHKKSYLQQTLDKAGVGAVAAALAVPRITCHQ